MTRLNCKKWVRLQWSMGCWQLTAEGTKSVRSIVRIHWTTSGREMILIQTSRDVEICNAVRNGHVSLTLLFNWVFLLTSSVIISHSVSIQQSRNFGGEVRFLVGKCENNSKIIGYLSYDHELTLSENKHCFLYSLVLCNCKLKRHHPKDT